ncbi:hypothetical protein BX666DRAFT_1958879 [Dichotomocladium elegans]|nr:hypothetical protein BX666DRAFT_1958879 [Dichotomocladium elegans]
MQSDRSNRSTPVRPGDLASDSMTSPFRFTEGSPIDNAFIHSFGARGTSLSPIVHQNTSGIGNASFAHYGDNSDLAISTTPLAASRSAVFMPPLGDSFSITTRPPLLFPADTSASMLRTDSREDRLRIMRYDAQQMHLTKAAIFYGEKIMAITDDTNDIYWLAQVYYDSNQFERALDLLNKKNTLNKSVQCRYLAGLCANALENWRDVLDYLGLENPFADKEFKHDVDMDGRIKLEASMCYVRGTAYLHLRDIEKAKRCFKEALFVDVRCYDALEALVQYNMLDERAEWEFIMTLPYDEHCGADAEFFRSLYILHLKKYSHINEVQEAQKKAQEELHLKNSLDVLNSTAESLLAESKFKECLKICEQIQEQDALYVKSIPAYLSCLYELGEKNRLYELAQELVDKLNDEAVTWHAVGMYYLYIKKYSDARRYFSQATAMDPYFEASWLGYGHAFAAENDHDQAINAYLSCSKLIPGAHLPYMYIGMEYMKQNLMDTAYEYLRKSLSKSASDPYLLNEFAVYHYQKKEYTKALEYARTALKLAKGRYSMQSSIWPLIWANLGHVYRNLGEYDRALKCFHLTLIRDPTNSDARGAIGLIYYLQRKYALAVTEYQEALRNAKSDGLLLQLIDRALLSAAKEPLVAITNQKHSSDNLFAPGYKEDDPDVFLDEEIAALDTNQLTQFDEEVMDHGDVLDDNMIDESILIDDGDLRPNMSREWL